MADLLTRMNPNTKLSDTQDAQVWRVANGLPSSKKEQFDLVGRLRSGETIFAGTEHVTVGPVFVGDGVLAAAPRLALDRSQQLGYDYAMIVGQSNRTFDINFYVDTKKSD